MKRHLALVIAIALTVITVIGIGGGALAAWSDNSAATGTVTGGKVAVTAQNASNTSYQFTSGTTSPAARIELKNTGSVPITGFTASVSGTAGSALATVVTYTVWDLGLNSTSSCGTAPTQPAPLTWATITMSWPALASGTSVPPGQFEAYCIASTISANDFAANPGASTSPTIAFTGVDHSWTSTASTAAAVALSLSTPAPATPSATTIDPPDAGITPQLGSVTVSGTVDGNGTISNAYYICLDIKATPTIRTLGFWSFQIDTTLPPWNGSAPAQWWSTQPDGVGGVSGPDKNGIVTLSGWSVTAVDIPVCIHEDSGAKPAVQPAGSETYTVGNSRLASCASAASPATLHDACIYTTVTGNYPYFYINYQFTVNVYQVVNGSGVSTSLKTSLQYLPITQALAPAGSLQVTGGGRNVAYTLASSGRTASDGAITKGNIITISSRLGTS